MSKHTREYYREYYRKNRKRILAYRKAHYKEYAERIHEREARWRKKNPEKERAKHRRYYYAHLEEVRAKGRAWKRARRKENPELVRAKDRDYYRQAAERKRAMAKRTHKRLMMRCAVDAAAYARKRTMSRMSAAKRRVLTGKPYRPRFSSRLPDWSTFGQFVIDAGSQWLGAYITPSQRAFAKELAIERKIQRERL